MLRHCAAAAAMSSCAAALSHADITVSSQVVGQSLPNQVPGKEPLINGGFLINPNPLAPATGDGIDETTIWDFNVATSPDWDAFDLSDLPLVSAVLTLTLTQHFPHGPVTDVTRPLDLAPSITLPSFLEEGETDSIQINLLDTYTPLQLLGVLDARNGVIPMIYSNDAVVSFAKIELTRAIPAPGSLALVALGIFLSAFRVRRPR